MVSVAGLWPRTNILTNLFNFGIITIRGSTWVYRRITQRARAVNGGQLVCEDADSNMQKLPAIKIAKKYNRYDFNCSFLLSVETNLQLHLGES